MVCIAVTKEVAAPAAAVWELLADFGDISWMPVGDRVDVDGDGIGMSRSIHGAGDKPIVETLTHLDPDRMELGYAISDNPLPVSRFEAIVAVRPVEAGSSIIWNVDYDPLGPSESDAEAARQAVEAVYGMMAGWLADAAANRKQV
ncbi:SRPBCC family protein [Mycobacterium sp. UM_CSW]|uniref:SRPBCC family protein n=1 Tax=Mycobacterium sp. UM_CSW TaxID=1370119 RepID=UPI000421B5AB|nr:SRPBCC family protein [Mycobacterium sp. UM_CSW]